MAGWSKPTIHLLPILMTGTPVWPVCFWIVRAADASRSTFHRFLLLLHFASEYFWGATAGVNSKSRDERFPVTIHYKPSHLTLLDDGKVL